MAPAPWRRPPLVSLLPLAWHRAAGCGLPFLLATVGLGSVWLGGLTLIAAPNRVFLLAAATICLVAAAILLSGQRSVAACARGTFSSRPAVRCVTLIGLLVGLALLYLGYAYV
jgi:mercuric ion transport protein